MAVQRKENNTMHFFKCIGCIMVVLIHYNYGGELGDCIKALGRFAVPYFFFVSGYFYLNRDMQTPKAVAWRKLQHILKLCAVYTLTYIVFCVFINYVKNPNWDVAAFIAERVTKGKVLKFLVTQDPFVYAHFWYMLAMVWIYVIMLVCSFFTKRANPKACLGISVALMVIYICLAELKCIPGVKNYIPIEALDITVVVSNCFVFRALPFFLFGVYLRQQGAWCSGVNSRVLYRLILAGCVLSVIEARVVGALMFYIGTYLVFFAMCILSVKDEGVPGGDMIHIGKNLSANVYAYHIAVGELINVTLQKTKLWGNEWVMAVRPWLVLLLTLAVAEMIFRITGWCKLGKKRKLP